MQLSSRVLSALQENGYEQMTSIQGLSIKRILETKNNVAIKSQTGSGKTIAYLAPIIHFLCEAEKKIAREDGS
jgi:superfamily II DNA/RNA helicase